MSPTLPNPSPSDPIRDALFAYYEALEALPEGNPHKVKALENNRFGGARHYLGDNSVPLQTMSDARQALFMAGALTSELDRLHGLARDFVKPSNPFVAL